MSRWFKSNHLLIFYFAPLVFIGVLFVMIRAIIEYGHRAVKLFYEKQPNHLVRKSHF